MYMPEWNVGLLEAETRLTELVEYLPPSPPPKTGDHRYVFALLAPVGDGGAGELKRPKERPHWGYGKVGKGVSDWADENGLTVVGEYALMIRGDRVADVP